MRRDLLELGVPGLVAAMLLLVAPYAAVLGFRERTAGRGRVAHVVETQVASAKSALLEAQLLLDDDDDAEGALRMAREAIDQLKTSINSSTVPSHPFGAARWWRCSSGLVKIR